MDNKPKFDLPVDLLAFADALPIGKLRGVIEAFRDMHSARSDLAVAVNFSTGLRTVQDKALQSGKNQPAEDAALSFLCSAIVMYARATKSESNHRKTYDFRKWLDDDEKKSHEVIVGLRDDAVAHYGPGVNFGGQPWQAERIFLVPPDGQVVAVSSRLVVSPQIIFLLEKQTHRALVIAERETRRREAQMVSTLSQAMQDDAGLTGVLRSFGLNMGDAMGDHRAVSDLLNGPRNGYRRMFSRYASSDDT